jgi:hypothetical protein
MNLVSDYDRKVKCILEISYNDYVCGDESGHVVDIWNWRKGRTCVWGGGDRW